MGIRYARGKMVFRVSLLLAVALSSSQTINHALSLFIFIHIYLQPFKYDFFNSKIYFLFSKLLKMLPLSICKNIILSSLNYWKKIFKIFLNKKQQRKKINSCHSASVYIGYKCFVHKTSPRHTISQSSN